VKLILTCYRELLVTNVIKNILGFVSVLYRSLYLKLFLSRMFVILIIIAVELNYLMLSKSYRTFCPKYIVSCCSI
jgi:hypothetical protein